MGKIAILINLLLLFSLGALSKNIKPPLQEMLFLQMVQDSSRLTENKNEEVTLHKVWRLKYVNKLHPLFSGMNTGFIEGEWNIVDFTNPDSVKIIPKDGEQHTRPYRIVNNEIIFPVEGRKKKIKKNETRISVHISQLTTHHLGITHYIHAGEYKKDFEGKFIEWVFEEVQ